MKTEFLGLIAGIILVGCSSDAVTEEIATEEVVVPVVTTGDCNCYVWTTRFDDFGKVIAKYKENDQVYSNNCDDNGRIIQTDISYITGTKWRSMELVCVKK